jgi:hypothetical protein
MTKYSEFYDRFKLWLDPREISNWTKNRVGRELPPKYPKGRVAKEDGQYFIGNMSLKEPDPSEKPLTPYVVVNDKLVKEV